VLLVLSAIVLMRVFLPFWWGWEDAISYDFFLSAALVFPVMLIGVIIYSLPLLIAMEKRHPQLTALAIVNILLGWNVIGWVAALAWAFMRPTARLTR